MNFPNIELLLDEQDYQNFLFLEIKKKIMLFIILSQTTPDANSIFAKILIKKACTVAQFSMEESKKKLSHQTAPFHLKNYSCLFSITDAIICNARATKITAPAIIFPSKLVIICATYPSAGRDYETTNVTMTAAETGHLIFSTLHTVGAANTIDRIIDVFPPNQQKQIAIQLSMVLQAVVSQQLVPSVDGKMVAAFEIMTMTPAIRNMIRDNKTPQIDGILYASNSPTMISMDSSLLNLYRAGQITRETALTYASNVDMMSKKL